MSNNIFPINVYDVYESNVYTLLIQTHLWVQWRPNLKL